MRRRSLTQTAAPVGAEVSPSAAAVASRLYAGLQDGDLEAVSATLHPDVRLELAAGMPLGLGGPHEGRDAALRMWRRLGATFEVTPVPEVVYEIGQEIGAGAVIVRGRYVGRHRRSGRPFEAGFVHVVEVSDALVRSLDQLTDTHRWHQVLRDPDHVPGRPPATPDTGEER